MIELRLGSGGGGGDGGIGVDLVLEDGSLQINSCREEAPDDLSELAEQKYESKEDEQMEECCEKEEKRFEKAWLAFMYNQQRKQLTSGPLSHKGSLVL